MAQIPWSLRPVAPPPASDRPHSDTSPTISDSTNATTSQAFGSLTQKDTRSIDIMPAENAESRDSALLLSPLFTSRKTASADHPPFRYTPEQLAKLHDPKDLKALDDLGGIDHLALGLGTKLDSGLSLDEEIVALDSLSGAPTIQKGKQRENNRLSKTTTMTRSPTEASARKPLGQRFSVDRAFSLLPHHREPQPFKDRRRVFGANTIQPRKPKTIFQLMWAALHDKVLILLCIAAGVSLGLGFYQSFRPGAVDKVQWVEGVAILAAVIIITLAQAVNDFQQERKFRTLNAKNEDRDVRVVRSGRTRLVNVHDIVVGDIMLLEAGDVIPVDGVLIGGYNVMCDESSATGESELVRKVPANVALKVFRQGSSDAAELDPYILSGSEVRDGVGRYLVTAVGVNSYHGRTLTSLQVAPEQTPLQVKLSRVADLIVKIGTISALLLFVVLFVKFLVQLPSSTLSAREKGQQFIQILIVSVVIFVIAVPEGLPLAVTLSLAYATVRMLRDRNLVRVLQACETMGNATTVCSDKTGTLTQNSMQIVAGTIGLDGQFEITGTEDEKIMLTPPQGDKSAIGKIGIKSVTRFFNDLPLEIREVLREGIVANTTAFEQVDGPTNEFVGSRTEAALLDICRTYLGMDDLVTDRDNLDIIQEFPFNADRKFMAVVIEKREDERRWYRLYVKGASEWLLQQCTLFVDLSKGATISALGEDQRTAIASIISDYATKSLRTLGLLFRDFDPLPQTSDNGIDSLNIRWEDIFMDMIWIGVVGMKDPLRPGVIEAVKDCQKAGVKVRMVTGDNVATAKAIAVECGILHPDGVVLEGPSFRKLSTAELNELVPKLEILARSSPDDKRRLVQHLKTQGEIVAVTGDGTNDGPALRTADVGFSMGRAGTEVAKEASSIVLMDDDFGSIVQAILWGRCVNDAVKKFLQFQMTVTISAVTLAFVSSVASQNEESVLTAVQLLWLNLVQDTLAALALATDPPIRDLLDRQPEPRTSPIVTFDMWKMIVGQSLLQIVVGLVLNFAGPKIFASWTPAEVKTVVFNSFVWLQISNQLNCRRIDNKLNVFAGVFRNYLFLSIFFLTIAGQVIIIFVGGSAFSVTRLDGVQWAVSLILGILSLPAGALLRLLPNKYLEALVRPLSRLPLARILPTRHRDNPGNPAEGVAPVDTELEMVRRRDGAGIDV